MVGDAMTDRVDLHCDLISFEKLPDGRIEVSMQKEHSSPVYYGKLSKDDVARFLEWMKQ